MQKQNVVVSLPKKLGIKPGFTVSVLNAPSGFLEKLAATMHQAQIITSDVPNADIIHYFASSSDTLEEEFPRLKMLLGKPHALWVSWPKKISGIPSDLNENIVRSFGLQNGLVDVKVASIDESWSGLKFVYRLKDR